MPLQEFYDNFLKILILSKRLFINWEFRARASKNAHLFTRRWLILDSVFIYAAMVEGKKKQISCEVLQILIRSFVIMKVFLAWKELLAKLGIIQESKVKLEGH